MKKYTPYLLAMALVIMAFAGVYSWLTRSDGRSHYYVSATTPRLNGVRQWEKLLGPAKPIPKPDPSLLTSIKPTIDQPDQIRYEYTNNDTLRGEEVNYTIEDRRNTANDRTTSSTINILGYATGMITEEPRHEDIAEYDASRVRTAYVYFNPDGSPMDEETIQKIDPQGWNRKQYVRTNGHRFKIFYEINGLDSPRVLSPKLIDRQTRMRHSHSFSYSSSKEINWVDYNLVVWRSIPCDWVVDIVHGPDQTREIKPIEGATADFGDVQLRLLKLIQGDSPSQGYNNSTNGNTMLEVELRTESHHKEVMIFYAVSPACLHRSLRLELLDTQGNVIGERDLNEGTPNLGMAKLYKIDLDQIDRIRVVYHPHTRRVILPIDIIPGQPEANQDLENLAQITIPYFQFKSKYEMRSVIESLFSIDSTLNLTFSPINTPANLTFPRSYTNVTAGELLKDWASQFPGCHVYIDEEKGRIEIRPTKTLGQRFKAIMRKIERMTGL